MTLADIAFASLALRLPYNEEYPNCHIIQAIIQKYPRTRDYCDMLNETFKEWKETALKSFG